MSSVFPAAGSAYTYIGCGLNRYLGFLGGWAMLLLYFSIPLTCVIYGAETVGRLLPQVPYAAWAALFAAAMTVLNLLGIRSTARTNIILLTFMCVVIGIFMLLAIRYLWLHQGWGGLFSIEPIYNRREFNIGVLLGATSFSAFTYIGFDSVTTLAEDVKNPRRNVLLATVLVCLLTGIFSSLQIYLAQRVWPDYRSFPQADTAFMDVSRRVGGVLLFHSMAAILIAANLGSGLGAQVTAARLLFGMGRDRVLPHKVFAYINVARNSPVYNLLIVGALSFAGAMLLSYERAGEVLNFGAFLAFMGVNLAALRYFYFARGRAERHWLRDAAVPALGFLSCLVIWWSLPPIPKKIGALWMLIGLVYEIVQTRGFRKAPVMIAFPD